MKKKRPKRVKEILKELEFDELLNSGASWAMSFTRDTIIKALDNA